ncbi:Cytochrome C biogenesis protein transmembrane region [Candidatus Izimaplasma bacterium HR1]|jgi:cytochrome c biogenesis protein CcdA|uniref:cytochrome c biogenesis CcdA family protein n=1 Tax=Candidatus Izimoplasma sp. HR1 TaxID=1541959 RepID=UPI0004F6FFD3|nr:Cytochrome C biogenesis protein transmembrane region [Candidatus Izimaplasma bacterium HR1]
MKKTWYLLLTILLTLTLMIAPVKVQSASKEVVYFKERTCLVCIDLEETGYIQQMIDSGINVTIYDLMSDDKIDEYSYTDNDDNLVEVTALDVFAAFNEEYEREAGGVPVIFVSDTYFEDPDIKGAIDDNSIFDLSDNPLLEVTVEEGQAFGDLSGIVGFFIVLGAGLLDGFNPCAIALLLLFIGLLVGAKDKKVLLMVSITYIGALFLSYFLIGTFFLEVLERYTTQIELIGTIINWFVIILCFVLFSLNFYDFIQARNEKYGKIKNQLPKFVQKYNKKIVKAFTRVINNEDSKGGLIGVLGITFLLGITLSVTELVCTGQIYFGILYGIHSVGSGYAYILLLFYNIMFVLPLIIIAVVAIRLKSVVTISNWIREHLSIIKLVTAIFFLGIFIFFLIRLF